MEPVREVQAFEQSLLPFDPLVLILDAARKWMLILVIAVLFGMGAYIYTDTGYVPDYRTSATLVLTSRDSASTIYSNLDSTAELATVFTEILNSSVMRSKILEELGQTEFHGSIHASAIAQTNLLTIEVTAQDPRTAFQVIRVLLDMHEMVTYDVMGNIVLEVLEAPVVPTSPANAADAGRTMVLVMAATAAAMYVLLLILAYFKDVVRSREEAEQKLDCRCLGEIFHEKTAFAFRERTHRKKMPILITDPETSFRYVTGMSKLRRRVEQHMQGGRVLMVTSVMENEGKSTISANLALAMAQKQEKVLLIDLDFHKPACRKLLGDPLPEFWTDDVICGKVSLPDAVRPHKRSSMDVLFAKHGSAPDAGELIRSGGLPLLLEQAREQYDQVVIDLPPMSMVSDAEIVMEYADASLLVIRQNGARTVDMNRAVQDLQRGRAKLLGCVLNDVQACGILSGGGYGSGYGRYSRYAARHDGDQRA